MAKQTDDLTFRTWRTLVRKYGFEGRKAAEYMMYVGALHIGAADDNTKVDNTKDDKAKDDKAKDDKAKDDKAKDAENGRGAARADRYGCKSLVVAVRKLYWRLTEQGVNGWEAASKVAHTFNISDRKVYGFLRGLPKESEDTPKEAKPEKRAHHRFPIGKIPEGHARINMRATPCVKLRGEDCRAILENNFLYYTARVDGDGDLNVSFTSAEAAEDGSIRLTPHRNGGKTYVTLNASKSSELRRMLNGMGFKDGACADSPVIMRVITFRGKGSVSACIRKPSK